LVVYFQGGDSLIGSLIDSFDTAAPKFLSAIDNFSNQVLEKVGAVIQKISDFISGAEFAPQRQRLVDALLMALDVAIVGSGLLAKLGFTIGEMIFDGILAGMAERAPRLMSLLGIKSKSETRDTSDLLKQNADVTQAQDFMQRFGEDDTAKVFPPEVMEKARERNARLASPKMNMDIIKKNPEALRILMSNPALVEALQDGKVTVQEMIANSGVAEGFTQLKNAMGQSSPVFNTNVTVNGATLGPVEMRQAIEMGVHEAQQKTLRDLANQAQSSIVE
jgi:hypothetical protein